MTTPRIAWLLLFACFLTMLVIARTERGRLDDGLLLEDRNVIRVPLPVEEAKDKLIKVSQEVEEITKAIADQARPIPAPPPFQRPPMIDDDLQRQLKDAEGRMVNAVNKLAILDNEDRQKRLQAAGAKAVVAGFGRGQRLEMQTRFEPRALRDPNFKPAEANAAAVAAASATGSGGGGGGAWPGSTVYGDFLRGEAELTRAIGHATLDTSKAAINRETAKALNMDNRIRWTETFFEMRRINRAARAREAGPSPTMEECIAFARKQAPRRLGTVELDPVTGSIRWPLALTDDIYKTYRTRLEDRFQERAALGTSVTYAQVAAVSKTIEACTQRLRDNIAKYAGGQYGQAKNFLESLLAEYQRPSD
jgi:hypothetical protein